MEDTLHDDIKGCKVYIDHIGAFDNSSEEQLAYYCQRHSHSTTRKHLHHQPAQMQMGRTRNQLAWL